MTDTQHVFGSIFLLANKLQMIGDRGSAELTLKQWFLLMMISKMDKELPSMTDIANFTGSTRQNVTKMLLILEKKGYVKMNMLPEDKKSVRVTLTEKSRDYFSETEEVGNELLGKIFTNISQDKIKSVSEVFSIMFENIDAILEVDTNSKIPTKDVSI